ncbi:His-Xaa-Ser system protein HxsD [Celerinatantimonas diazotrophica]|uniref:His-Xaa-Ser system protein HxsD n=1 Tax=Celerinatantimonas diazotrophica TaxID=412034 RepID=A0A4R1K1F5_9GAMM|nr:His-Xaa-Ser system protein HxsD [Celerinatantimonas diazotrophica]TCK57826.1 His-Xaa-Ser system protein HxsD [Celerinatantimonas diazotrophica]CAG9298110.1 hypothetical protein CEDIAZO_03305 [Celerinatantimonas diazotrophica]
MPSQVTISFDRHIFSQEALLHACYELAELAAFDIRIQDNDIVVLATGLSKQIQSDNDLITQFRTVAIDYQLREKIVQQTQSIRETLIHAALSHAKGDF